MRCVPRSLMYVQYTSTPRALRIRTRVFVGGGTSSAAFHGARRTDRSVSGGLRAVRSFGVPCVRCASRRLADENPRFGGRRNLTCRVRAAFWREEPGLLELAG